MNTQNYPSWLVPLEIAIKLKEIGFNEPCHFYFLYYHGWEMLKKRGDEYGFITSNSCRAYVMENHNEIGNLSIPTWEQVLEWFRDRKYYGTLNTYSANTDKDGFSFYCEINYNNQYIKVYSKTYEEAREELVKTLIETYKTNEIL